MEELNFDLQTSKPGSPELGDFQRIGSDRSNAPIIVKDDAQSDRDLDKLMRKKEMSDKRKTYKEPGGVPITYFDNEAYAPEMFRDDETTGLSPETNGKRDDQPDPFSSKAPEQRKLPQLKRKLPEPQQKEDPVIFENLPEEIQRPRAPPEDAKRPHEARMLPKPPEKTKERSLPKAPDRPTSSTSSRKLPQVPPTKERAEPPLVVFPAISLPYQHAPGAPRSVDGRRRPKRTASSAKSSASVSSVGSGIHGTRRRRALPTPQPPAADAQGPTEKAAKDQANISLKPEKEPMQKRSLPDIPAAMAKSESSPPVSNQSDPSHRPLIGGQPIKAGPEDSARPAPASGLAESRPELLPSKPKLLPKAKSESEPGRAVGRSASLVHPQPLKPASRKASSASDGPRKKKRDLPTPPNAPLIPGFESLWETDEVQGSLV